MQLYRFSPIQDEKTLETAWEYVIEELEKLSQKILGETLPISYLTLFSHYPDEYAFLHTYFSRLGPEASFSSERTLYVAVNKIIGTNNIRYMGVRNIDPYRMQVGYGDFETEKFLEYKEKYASSPFVRDAVAHDNTKMLEIWHPDFDVLGYVIPKE